MIKDISIIRKELEGYEEVILPFEFNKGCSIKYITQRKKDNEESFYTGGEFVCYGNDCIVLRKKQKNMVCSML